MSETETADLVLKNWLEENAKTLVTEDGAFCTSFVMIAEYMDSNGQFYSVTLKDPDSPLWRVRGLIEYARENEFYLREEPQEDGDY